MLSHLTVPLLITDRNGKPQARNAAFRTHPFPLTAHPLRSLHKHNRRTVAALRDGEYRILSLAGRRLRGPFLLLRKGEQLFFLFSPILREQLFFSAEALDAHLARPMAQLLPRLLDGELTSAVAIAEAVNPLLAEHRPLTVECYASVAALTLRLLRTEDTLKVDLPDGEALLADPEEALCALGRLIDDLGDSTPNKEDPPPITLLAEDDTLYFDLPIDRIPSGPLRLPLAAETVEAFVYRESDALLSLLLATLFDTIRPTRPKIYQIITE